MNRETAEAYGLGAYGVAKGVFKEYIQPELTAERAWVGLVGAIAVYEALAPKNHLLSEGVDRMIDKHPIATRAVIAYTGAHLMNLLPEKVDIFHQLTK